MGEQGGEASHVWRDGDLGPGGLCKCAEGSWQHADLKDGGCSVIQHGYGHDSIYAKLEPPFFSYNEAHGSNGTVGDSLQTGLRQTHAKGERESRGVLPVWPKPGERGLSTQIISMRATAMAR